MNKTHTLIIFSYLIVSLLSCASDEVNKSYLFETTKIDVDGFEKVSTRSTADGSEYDCLEVYKLNLGQHNKLIEQILNSNDTLNKFGYWISNETYSKYYPSEQLRDNGHFFKAEYSNDLKVLIVHEIKI